MKILVVSSYYQPAAVYGGPVQSIHLRNMALTAQGHTVHTYTTDANGTGDLEVPTGRPVWVDGLPVTYFPRWWFGRQRKPFSLFFSPAMGKALRQLQPGDYDLMLLHATFGDPGRLAARAARRTGIPYICYPHGTFEAWALNHKKWKKRLYLAFIEEGILKRAAGLVVCNDGETQELRRLGIQTRVRRIPWGVDFPLMEEQPGCSRLGELWPILDGRSFILFLSRLHPKKGLDLLIPAFAALAKDFPHWLLVLAGPDEGRYRQTLENMARELAISDRVLFPGLVTGEAKAALLAHADLFALPSYSEGFPVVVGEALGYGRPVIITTSCYIPEVAAQGAGLVIPPEKEALTRALREMLSDAAMRQSCSLNARRLAETTFTWEAVARQSLEFYREVAPCPSSD